MVLTLGQNIRNFLAATLCNRARRRFFTQTVHRGADHVVRVLRTDGLGHNVLDAQHFENGTHWTTGDDTGTFWCCTHNHFTGAVTAFHVVVQCTAFAQLNADHLALRLLGGFADGFRNLFRFTFTKAYAAFLVANNDKCGEAKALTTFNGLGNTVDRHQAVGEFWSLFALVAAIATPVVISLPCGIILLVRRKRLSWSILVGLNDPRIIEAAHRVPPALS